jgi:hypothetical protein
LEESNQERERREAYEAKESDQDWEEAKRVWKQNNPEQTLKEYKAKYIRGAIDTLPWEDDGYVQNSEQNENSIWNKLKEQQDKNE